MKVIASDRQPGSTRAGDAHSLKPDMCTPRRIAGSVGHAICALVAATRRRTREARRAAISFATGWTFALRAIANFQARDLNTSPVDRGQVCKEAQNASASATETNRAQHRCGPPLCRSFECRSDGCRESRLDAVGVRNWELLSWTGM